MPVTTKFQIPYPDGTSTYAPLQDWFAGIATGVENALNTGLGGAPRLANSDTERNTIYPSPVQGNTVIRPDKGWTEQYFATYNASTNPSGATPSGWYPVAGAQPLAVARRTTTALAINSGSYTNISANAAWTPNNMGGITYTDGFIVPLAGIYEVEWSLIMVGTMAGIAGIGVNIAGSPGGDVLHAVGPIATTAASMGNGSALVTLAANDKLTFWGYGSGASGNVAPLAGAATHWGVRWVRPNAQ